MWLIVNVPPLYNTMPWCIHRIQSFLKFKMCLCACHFKVPVSLYTLNNYLIRNIWSVSSWYLCYIYWSGVSTSCWWSWLYISCHIMCHMLVMNYFAYSTVQVESVQNTCLCLQEHLYTNQRIALKHRPQQMYNTIITLSRCDASYWKCCTQGTELVTEPGEIKMWEGGRTFWRWDTPGTQGCFFDAPRPSDSFMCPNPDMRRVTMQMFTARIDGRRYVLTHSYGASFSLRQWRLTNNFPWWRCSARAERCGKIIRWWEVIFYDSQLHRRSLHHRLRDRSSPQEEVPRRVHIPTSCLALTHVLCS